LNNPVVVPIVLEFEPYSKLKDICEAIGISVSEVIRNLIDEFIASYYSQPVEAPVAGGLSAKAALTEKLNKIDFCEEVARAMSLKKIRDKHGKGTIDWYHFNNKLRKSLRRAVSLARKLKNPPKKFMDILMKMIEEEASGIL